MLLTVASGGACTCSMDWTACVAPEPAKPGKAQVAIGRFGHSATLVDARDVWGTELVVVFGGVVPATDNEQPDQHAAVSDVAVLQAEPPARWFAPALAPEGTWWVPMRTHACAHASMGSAPCTCTGLGAHAASCCVTRCRCRRGGERRAAKVLPEEQ